MSVEVSIRNEISSVGEDALNYRDPPFEEDDKLLKP